jgi:hypothetical protein
MTNRSLVSQSSGAPDRMNVWLKEFADESFEAGCFLRFDGRGDNGRDVANFVDRRWLEAHLRQPEHRGC